MDAEAAVEKERGDAEVAAVAAADAGAAASGQLQECWRRWRHKQQRVHWVELRLRRQQL